jgi:hypothetical protein
MAKQAEKKPAEAADYIPKPPKQVQDQIAAAEALRAEMDKSATPPEGEQPPEQQQAPEPTPRQAPDAPPPAAVTPPAEDEQSWEQRYRSQQGRLESVQKNNQALIDRLASLENQLATMKLRGAEEERPPAAVPSIKPKLVTDKEAEEYGDEFLTVVGKRAKEEFLPEFDNLAERLKRLESRVEGVGTIIDKSQVTNVYSTLAEQVPEWRDVNRSEQFKAWLQVPDPYSGRRRHDMLQEAFSRHETGRVVSFFRGFLTEATGTPPSSSSPGNSAPHPNGSGKPSLEQFAAPGRARSAPQDLPPDKPIYTQAWIAQFSADKLMGKFRGREADADAIERDIYQAQHEGRIH